MRLRRPGDQATLHFFWLCLAFFGAFTFSFNGRLDRLDWVFYWGDAVSILLLPPLFLHFTLVFPERPRSWVRSAAGASAVLPLLYLPAALLGLARVVAVARAPRATPTFFTHVLGTARSRRAAVPVACACGRPRGAGRARSADVRSVTARRQLRWIVWGTALGALPFAFGYALPWALGLTPSLPMELSAMPLGLVPLAFASAIVRYRLMDVEVIVKRALVYAAAVGAIAATLRGPAARWRPTWSSGRRAISNWVIALLATLVVVLLAQPGEERDPGRARSRVLPRPLRLPPRARRLRARPEQRPRPRSPRRAARHARRRDAGRRSHGADAGRRAARATSRRSRDVGFADDAAGAGAALRRSAAALEAGHTVALDDPIADARGSPTTRSSSGATAGSTTSCRASRRKARSRCSRSAARRATSRSTARTWRC